MMLKSLVVADPVGNVAELVTTQCRRLAERRAVATHGEQCLALVGDMRPELVVLSLEISRPSVEKLVPKIIRQVPDVLIVATFRELTVPQMEQLNRLGIDDFVAQPINATEVFRAVSRRFHMPFRQHQRFEAAFEVTRADGPAFGRTLNISEGGVRLALALPLKADESVLVDLVLPDGLDKPLRVRMRILALEGSPPLLARAQFENLRGEEHRRLISFVSSLDTHVESDAHL